MPSKLIFQQNLANREFNSALVIGAIAGAVPEVKFGYATAIAALGDVWPNATPYAFPVTGGQDVTAVSTDIADTHILRVEGIDAVTKLVRVEEVTLTGQVAVAVPGTWLAINRAFNNNGTAYAGTVTVQGDGTPNSNVFAVVLPDDQQTTQTPYMVPFDKVAVINNYSTAINKASGVDISSIMRLVVTRDGKVPRTQIRYGLQRDGASNISSDLIVPIPVPPLARIQVTAEPSSVGDISAEYSMILIDKTLLDPDVLQAIIEG